MSHYYKSPVVRSCILLLVLFILTTNSYSLIIANRGEEAFADNLENGLSIRTGIIDGAGYFLKSYSEAFLLLQEIEWSTTGSVDYAKLNRKLDNTVDNLGKAFRAYLELTVLSYATPYNPVFLDKLVCFDYDGFQRERSINGAVFTGVKRYLSAGDVRGVFARICFDSAKILFMLRGIRASLEAETFPELSTLWRVNQLFSETMLFGQYAAEVFYEAGGNKE